LTDDFFVVHRAWQQALWCKSTMGICNRQPLAEGKSLRCEAESEGSLKQTFAPRNTNRIRRNRWDEIAKQIEVQRLHGHRDVNAAVRWRESQLSYHGRSHRRIETEFDIRSEKVYCEKSAEVIV
jgi:hypothetical protein